MAFIYKTYEKQYMDNLVDILYDGDLTMNNRTKIATRRVPSTTLSIDLEKEFPILQSKKVNWKIAVKEILWIMQAQSNEVSKLGSKIWDQWADNKGTIGKSYGYQVGKPVKRKEDGIIVPYLNQVDYVLTMLNKDSSSRQCVIDMWNVQELQDMNLVPCCYSSVWNIIDGKLNCMLVQRSADYPIGVPFDTTQYAALTHMFARHLGVKPGMLTHCMADSHIYENQIPGVVTQIKQWDEFKATEHSRPQFKIRDGVDNFWDMRIEDFEVTHYTPMPAIKFEVAV